ncbi:retrovirus-related pol polyprotein from transposon TNT 1-94 [Tanacetum coccineum]
MVEKKFFDEVVLRCSRLENRSANLELKLQHQKESFLNNRSLNNQNALEISEFFKINEWQAKLDAKDVSIANLRKHIKSLKGKNVVEKDVQPNNTNEHPGTLREIVEHARALRPLDSDLNSTCMYVQRIQEVLVYVPDTCPSLTKPSEKLVPITPLNKNKKLGMKSSTSASRSQPSGNIKNNRISRTTSSNMMNKVEDQPRTVKSSSNKKNRVIEPICNANVKHTMLNANSELICVKCNQCMFDANHDVCFLEFVNDVNVRSKSKSAKSGKKKNIWKPTGKVLTDIGYRWKPTRRTFTINGNTCPLTRISSTKVEPLKENTSKSVTTPNPEIKIYCRKTKVAKLVDLSSEPSTVRFGNDQIAKIMGYGVYQMGNLFANYDLEGVDLLKGSRGSNLYTLSLEDMMLSSPICLLSKVSKTNFRRITYVPPKAEDSVQENLKLRTPFKKTKKHTHKPKAEDSIQENLYLLHMDLCGPIRIQIRLNATVQNIRTNNGKEFVNQTLRAYYEYVRISHQTSDARSPQQNDVVKRRNQTLVEAARTMLIFSRALLFLWVEAVVTACYTQNRSLISKCHNKTPYELLHNRKPDLSYLHVFGALCYPTNDSEDLGQLKPKADIGIFVGYAPAKKAYRIYNKRTRLIIETIHIDFDELTAMDFEQFSSGSEPQLLTPGTITNVDEYFNPPPSVVSLVPAAAAPRPADPTGTPSSTTIDQDAPSPSTSQTPQETKSPVIPSDVEEHFHDIEVAHLDNDPFFGVLISKSNSEESSSRMLFQLMCTQSINPLNILEMDQRSPAG